MCNSSEVEQDLKQLFEQRRGSWPEELFRDVLKLDKQFFELYLKLFTHPWERGVLDKKVKEMICIAVNASTTHLYEPALRVHIKNALDLGISKEEILEVLELTSVLGIHSITFGVPILIEEYEKFSGARISVQRSQKQIQIMERFRAERGYWSERLWGALLDLDPEFLEKYLDYSAFPWKKGKLDPKTKELIYIAIDVSTTHLYEPGLRQHISNALRYGATIEEILEVMEIAAEIGFHTCILGCKLLEELKV